MNVKLHSEVLLFGIYHQSRECFYSGTLGVKTPQNIQGLSYGSTKLILPLYGHTWLSDKRGQPSQLATMPHAHFCSLLSNPTSFFSFGTGFPSKRHHSQLRLGSLMWRMLIGFSFSIAMKVFSGSQPHPILCTGQHGLPLTRSFLLDCNKALCIL